MRRTSPHTFQVVPDDDLADLDRGHLGLIVIGAQPHRVQHRRPGSSVVSTVGPRSRAICALASAFMNWTASNPASFRSVAVFVSAPVLLALTTDRTISVVRRHVLGMREDDGSVWARAGRGVGMAALWALRLVVDFRATRAGIRQAIVMATPLPRLEERAAEPEDLDVTAILREELAGRMDDLGATMADLGRYTREDLAALRGRLERLELEAAANGHGAAVYPSKKAHFLALYRAHGEYGRREVASRVAGELAGAAGLQPGTARAYVYEELARQQERDTQLLAGYPKEEQ